MPEELVAVYADPDEALRAVLSLRDRGVSNAQVSSPAAFPVVHEVEHTGHSRALGWVALVGGLTGLGCAIALQVGTSKSMGLIVGGKPIVAWTAFGVVMFELTMLFAGVSNFLALAILSAVSRRKVARAVRDLVRSEQIVVTVPLAGMDPKLRDVARGVLGRALAEVSP